MSQIEYTVKDPSSFEREWVKNDPHAIFPDGHLVWTSALRASGGRRPPQAGGPKLAGGPEVPDPAGGPDPGGRSKI